MNKQSYQTLNSEQNGNSKSFLPQPQPVAVPWGEEKDESFSIRDWLSIVKRRSRVIAGVSIVVMTIVAVNVIFRKQPIEYESNFFMLVEPVNDDSEAINIVKETSSSTSKLDYDSQILVLKSPEIMRNTLQALRISYPDITYPSLLESLTINRVGETKIIETRYRANDPNEVSKVLELISKDYLEYSQERRQTKLRQGIQFIDKQLPSIQKRVDQIQQELQFFRQKYDFSSPESKGNALDAQASTLAGTQQSIKLQLTQVRDQLNLLQTEKGKTTVLNNASLYQQLVSQLMQLDTQIATESTLLESNNPRLQTLKEKRASLLPVLQQEEKRFLDVRAAELRTQLQSLELQSAEIAKISHQLEQQRKQVPILARQYTEIQRRLQFANDSLNRFLSTRETLQIQISQTELGWQLIQPPSEPKLVNSSSRLRSLTIGLFASIAAGIAVALLLEKISNTYNSEIGRAHV